MIHSYRTVSKSTLNARSMCIRFDEEIFSYAVFFLIRTHMNTIARTQQIRNMLSACCVGLSTARQCVLKYIRHSNEFKSLHYPFSFSRIMNTHVNSCAMLKPTQQALSMFCICCVRAMVFICVRMRKKTA